MSLPIRRGPNRKGSKPHAGNPDKPLTPLQARFVQEYLKDVNATEAAKRAGYKEKRANSAGWRLLTYPNVAKAVEAAQTAAAERTNVTVDALIAETATIAFARDATVETKDKLRAIDMLFKHLGAYIQRHEVTGKNGGPIETQALTPQERETRLARLLAEASARQN